jgi:glycosyltransferase involved in cell wall biosynthesis
VIAPGPGADTRQRAVPVTRIDQVIPTLASRDAIGGHTMQLRDLLRARGYASDIYFGNASADRLDDGYPVDRLGDRPTAGRVLLYHLSIGSPVSDVFRERPERKFVNYHNITPADLLEPWVPYVGDEVRRGRAQLAELAAVTEFAVADSRYNEDELVAAGYASTTTSSLLLDLDGFGGSPDPALAARLAAAKASGGADLLFVGKVSPHKGQDDLVKALAAYRRAYDPQARLHIVGGAISEEYQTAVERFAAELGLADAVEIAGSITHEELIAYYAGCDVFLCLTNHEGFCVPLLEAMYHRLPIVTWACTAVPETVGDAGLVLADKQPARVAAAIDRVVRDGHLRDELARAAAERVAWFSLPRAQDRFVAALEAACAAPG